MTVSALDNFMADLGVEAYRVGGSVRDELIGRTPKDADYMVRGITLPDLGYLLVSRTRGRGKVTALSLRDGSQVGFRVALRGVGDAEIVLPRKEISTGPGHRDFKIVVDPEFTLAEDATRRDFTFNALFKRINVPEGFDYTEAEVSAWHEDLGVHHDPTGRGLFDLERRMINVTHEDSFRDDPLRILRALRFVARGFELGSNTLALMKRDADSITGLSAKGHVSGTVYQELTKILASDNAVEALRIARDTGVLVQVLPELADMIGFDQESKYHDLTVDEHVFHALEVAIRMEAPLRVRWALLFHDSGKPASAWRGPKGRLHYYSTKLDDGTVTPDHADAGVELWQKAARRIGVESKLISEVSTLIELHMLDLEGKLRPVKIRRMRVELGDPMLADLIMHRSCDAAAKAKVNPDHVARLREYVVVQMEAIADKVPTSVRDLEINGHDVIAAGVADGDIGRTLNAVLDEVVCDPSEQKRSKEWQLARVDALR